MNDQMTRDDARHNISANVRYRLQILGWSVERLAQECASFVERNTVFRIASGRNLAQAHQIHAVADVLGVTIDSLMQAPSEAILEKLEKSS